MVLFHPKNDVDRLYVSREDAICAGQEQALRTNYVKYHIDKKAESPLCRLCSEKGKSVNHIVCECKKSWPKENINRHDNIAKVVHLEVM